MRSATIADSSDSTAARNAITNAEGSSSVSRSTLTCGNEGIGKLRGSAPYCEAIVSTGNATSATAADDQPDRDDQPGQAREQPPQQHDEHQCRAPAPAAYQCALVRACHSAASLGTKSAGQPGGRDPEEILELAAGDDDRDADREAVDHRLGHERDQAAGAQQPGDDQDRPCHQRRQHQPVVAVLGDHAVDHDDERAGRPADLHPAAAERRDQEPATIAVTSPAAGGAPEAMAIAMLSGIATSATLMPATRSPRNSLAV